MTNLAIRFLLVAVLVYVSSSTKIVGAPSIPWDDDLGAAFQQSAISGKPIMLHFYSNNCPPCKMLDTRAFKDEKVVAALSEQTIPLKINVDNQRSVADRYEVTRWPTDVYLHPNGDEIGRSVSPQDPLKYCELVNRVSSVNRGWITERIASQNAIASGQPSSLASSGASDNATPAATLAALNSSVNSNISTAADHNQRATAPRTAKALLVNDAESSVANNSIHGRSVVTKSTTFTTPAPSSRTESNPYCAPVLAPDGASSMQCNSGVEPSADSVQAQMVGFARETSQNRYAQASARLGGVMSEDITPAMDGYCAVTLRTQGAWAAGSPQFAIKHRGRIYHCVSEEARQMFLAQPDFYSPILSGYDIVHFCETGKLEPGRREFGCESGGHIFLFKDASTYETFRAQALLYLQQVSGANGSELVANTIESDTLRR
ncbi:MAG: thioredoxin family protein [Planctomycetota bacterium]|nr:thioredoxin family protein [Planctomycetota bacterium]